jgi:ceramide glucosyltransferase
MLSAILGTVAVVSAGINVWQWWAAGRFPLHRRTFQSPVAPNGPAPPGVTLFKPLKGADEETRGCLESWFAQEYRGPVQMLFGVADGNDPVCEIVRELQHRFPDRDSQLIICNPILGANAKVSTLTYLQREAKHPFWIVSDADVFAPPELLEEMIARFAPTEVGLVNCFYKLSPAKTIPMIWENIGANADFWSQVCQSNSMKPMNFALGAVMGVRRGAIEMIGGFKPLLNQLADDYQLGRRLADSGRKIELCNVVVECREHTKSFVNVWKHQLRWARTIRVCQPGPYFGSILSNTTIWALLWMAVSPLNNIAPLCLILRTVTAVHNEFRLTRRFADAFESIFAFAKDLLQFAVWLCAFTGNSVVWRGEKFLIKKSGDLIRA